MFQNPNAAVAAATNLDSVRARHPNKHQPATGNAAKGSAPGAAPVAPAPQGSPREKRMHAFLDKIDDILNFTASKGKEKLPEVPVTAPIIRFDPVYMSYKTFLSSADVVLSLFALVAVTVLLIFAPGDARMADLVALSRGSISRRIARDRHAVLPRMLSADIVLLLLSGMAVNSLVLSIIRVVEREHKKELERKLFDDLDEAHDTDPVKADAYEKKEEKLRQDRAAKRAALDEENEKRKKEGKPPKRHRVTVSGIVEVDSVTDAIVPIVVFWPIVLGTVVVLQGSNPVRGFGVVLLFTHMVIGAVLAKLVNSTTAVRAVFNVIQTMYQLTLMLMVGIQWYKE